MTLPSAFNHAVGVQHQAAGMSRAAARRPVVLVLHPSDELYGADRVLLAVLDAIATVIEPVVILPRDAAIGPLTVELERRGIKIERRTLPVIRRRDLSLVGIVKLAFRLPIGFANILRLARTHRARAIHTNTAILLGGSLAARMLGIGHVWHIHEILEDEAALGSVVSALSRTKGNRLVAVSDAVASAIAARRGVVAEVIRNPAPDWARQPLPTGPPRILMIGRVNGGKGHDVFVEAASSLHLSHPEIAFVMIGGAVPGREGPYDSLRHTVEAMDPEGRWLIFKGWCPDVAGEIRASTAVVLPSTKLDALNISALEAMASGRPVVASAIGGLPEVVIDGITGLLVPPRDPVALASAIDRLLRDPSLRRRLVKAAHKEVSERFSSVRYAQEWRQLYGYLSADEPSDPAPVLVT